MFVGSPYIFKFGPINIIWRISFWNGIFLLAVISIISNLIVRTFWESAINYIYLIRCNAAASFRRATWRSIQTFSSIPFCLHFLNIQEPKTALLQLQLISTAYKLNVNRFILAVIYLNIILLIVAWIVAYLYVQKYFVGAACFQFLKLHLSY